MRGKIALFGLLSVLGLASCGGNNPSVGDSNDPIGPSSPAGDSTGTGDSTDEEKFETKTTGEGGYFAATGDEQKSDFRFTFSELKEGDDGEWNSIEIAIQVKWGMETQTKGAKFTSSDEGVLNPADIKLKVHQDFDSGLIDVLTLQIDRSKVHKGTTDLGIFIDHGGMLSTDEAIELAVPVDIVEYGNVPAETFDEYFTISFDKSVDKTLFDGTKEIRFGFSEGSSTYVYGYPYEMTNIFYLRSEDDLAEYSTAHKATVGAKTHEYSVWAYAWDTADDSRIDKTYTVSFDNAALEKKDGSYFFESATMADSPIEFVVSEVSK